MGASRSKHSSKKKVSCSPIQSLRRPVRIHHGLNLLHGIRGIRVTRTLRNRERRGDDAVSAESGSETSVWMHEWGRHCVLWRGTAPRQPLCEGSLRAWHRTHQAGGIAVSVGSTGRHWRRHGELWRLSIGWRPHRLESPPAK